MASEAERSLVVQGDEFIERLTAGLADRDCPIAVAIVAAGDAVRQAWDNGLIDEESAAMRVHTLGLRALSLAAAQRRFGCPRLNMPVGDVARDAANYTCKLPTGLVEGFAFGSMGETMGNLMPRTSKTLGFSQ